MQSIGISHSDDAASPGSEGVTGSSRHEDDMTGSVLSIDAGAAADRPDADSAGLEHTFLCVWPNAGSIPGTWDVRKCFTTGGYKATCNNVFENCCFF